MAKIFGNSQINFSHVQEEEARKIAMDYGDELIAASRNKKKSENYDENGNINPVKVEYIIDQLVNHEENFSTQELREHLMMLMITVNLKNLI